MNFTREQKKSAYEKLKPEVQNFIMDGETTELVEKILAQAGLNEDQSNSADSEILLAMYNLQTLDDALRNIAQISNKNIADLSLLKTNLENNIFEKIDNLNGINSEEGVESLSPEVQKVVSEICQKYGLSKSQEEALVLITASHSKTKSSEGMNSEISQVLGVSSLLSEQIADDIENRVFNQQIKKIPSQNTPIANVRIPEVRPDNLPIMGNNFVPAKPALQNDVLDKQKVNTFEVPRYATPPAPVNSIIEKKLSNITGSTGGVNTPPITKYEKDPYREALN